MNSRILIVEDEEALAKLLEMNLKIARYETYIISDGVEAIQQLADDHRYDVAILDIMLPGADGFQVLEELNKYSIPVIFLSAKDDVESKVKGLKGGAQDYMVKPFEVLELFARIEKILEREKKSQEILSIQDIEINTRQHMVKKAGKEISLKPMEYELLLTLVKNRNIAISREKLLNIVWGTDYEGETRTVDVHIGQLRKKLGLYEQIKTIPKVGYRLEIV